MINVTKFEVRTTPSNPDMPGMIRIEATLGDGGIVGVSVLLGKNDAVDIPILTSALEKLSSDLKRA